MKNFFALLMAALLAITALGCSELQEPGKVFYLNCEPEANETWQKLATTYSDLYGVEVTIRTVTTEDCAATIRAALSWEDAPTAFHFHNTADLQRLKNSCLDLTGSAVLGQMITGSFNLTDGGAVKALCYSYDAFGLMVNKELLSAAGYDLQDISDYASLKAAAEDIHSRREELGFDAFALLAEDGSTAWQMAQAARFYQDRQTDSMGLLRQLLDLHLQNSSPLTERSAADGGLTQFAQSQAVFALHSTAIFSTLTAQPYNMNGDHLTMLPIYCGAAGEEAAALNCAPRSYWAVNSQASEADRQATLDFLNWVVSSEYGISVLCEQFGTIPFKAASGTKNKFCMASNHLLAAGNYPILPLDEENDGQQEAFATALAAYTAHRSDENWQKIQQTLATQHS